MKGRSAPTGGYGGGFKPMWRKQIWKTLTEGFPNKPAANALIMPSSEGDEIDWAETKGIRRGNIHVVDKNAAIVARLTRRGY